MKLRLLMHKTPMLYCQVRVEVAVLGLFIIKMDNNGETVLFYSRFTLTTNKHST